MNPAVARTNVPTVNIRHVETFNTLPALALGRSRRAKYMPTAQAMAPTATSTMATTDL